MASRLLLYLDSAHNRQRTAVGPTLAAAAERAGWGFECYYDARGKGRHFGGGDPARARPGWPDGGLVAGGRHLDQLLWLAAGREIAVVGDPHSVLWSAAEAAGCSQLVRSTDPATIYEAAFSALGELVPSSAVVFDCSPQGTGALISAPYAAPALLSGEARLAIEVSCDSEQRARLERLGVKEFRGFYVDEDRARRFSGGLTETEGSAHTGYAELTAELAERFEDWGLGILLGDPQLVASQLPRIRRRRLVALYGQPQTDVIARAAPAIRAAREPVYGRQYDDRDFTELARLGRGLQVVDPGPPFDASTETPVELPGPTSLPEPADSELERWAAEGRVLVTLLFWCGMIREHDCLARAIDLSAETGLKAGVLLTVDSLEQSDRSTLPLLSAEPERGGCRGLLEPLLASTGRGIAAETLLPQGVLADSLTEARAAAGRLLPGQLPPTGWWPLLDAPFVQSRQARIRLEHGRPTLLFEPRGKEPAAGEETATRAVDARRVVGEGLRRTGLSRLLDERRPYEDLRPGEQDRDVAAAVQSAGFEYMWSKSGFGRPTVLRRDGRFVALSLTAGNWDGWSPFYTVSRSRDLTTAERRLRRGGRPGWLVGTIDSPLWLLSGEVLEHGARVYELAHAAAAGGRSGELVNVTPNVVARYARLLDERGLLEAP